MKARTESNTIGRDQHLVSFEEPGPPAPDGEGGYTDTWLPLSPATWYVRLATATGRDQERVQAGTVVSHHTHMVHGRFHPGVTTKARMLFGGRTYQITSVVNIDGRGLEMELAADLQDFVNGD